MGFLEFVIDVLSVFYSKINVYILIPLICLAFLATVPCLVRYIIFKPRG